MIHTPINARRMESQSRPQYQRVFRTLHLKEHLLNGKTLLLALSKSDSLRKLSDCYQDQLSYIACNAKGYWGLYAPLIRPDSFIAWASDNFSDDSKAI